MKMVEAKVVVDKAALPVLSELRGTVNAHAITINGREYQPRVVKYVKICAACQYSDLHYHGKLVFEIVSEDNDLPQSDMRQLPGLTEPVETTTEEVIDGDA